MKLFPKLALLLSLVAVAPVVVFALLGLGRASELLRQRIAAEQSRRARLEANQVSDRIRGVLRSLTVYSGYADLGAAREEVLIGVLRVAYRGSDDLSILSLIDEGGEAVVPSVYLEHPERTEALRAHPAVSPEDVEIHAQHIPLEAALATGAAVGPPYGRPGHPRVALAVETSHRRSGRRLVLTAELSLERLVAALGTPSGSELGEVLLLAPEGRVIGGDGREISLPWAGEGGLPEGPESGAVVIGGERYLAAYSPVPVLGWGVLLRQREGEALAPLAQLRRRSTYWAVVSALLAVLLAGLVARDLSRRIGDLDRSAQALARGDLDRRVPVGGRDELAGLARSFNEMARDLEIQRDKIEQKNQEIRQWNETLEQRVRDKTDELARAQEVVLRARRLAGLGVLGAGVAHEINNPLTSAHGFLQIVLRDEELAERHRRSLEQVQTSTGRIREIVQELLKLADSQSGPPRGRVDVGRIVQRAAQLAEAAMGSQRVDLAVDLEDGLPAVTGNAEQLTEVLLHLIRNALRALDTGGRIRVRGRGTGRQFVTLEVEDNGRGIPPEMIDRVFDPFFTTKDDWEGRGLGLSVVHKIIEDHGGRLDLWSEVGQGTRVTLVLPVATGGRHLR